jgi:hypothetical protein
MACLIVAEKLADKKLKAKCLRFIKTRRNLTERAMMSRHWITISERYPYLAKTIVETMSDATNYNMSDYIIDVAIVYIKYVIEEVVQQLIHKTSLESGLYHFL